SGKARAKSSKCFVSNSPSDRKRSVVLPGCTLKTTTLWGRFYVSKLRAVGNKLKRHLVWRPHKPDRLIPPVICRSLFCRRPRRLRGTFQVQFDGKLFYRLVQPSVAVAPVPYNADVSGPAAKPQYVVP